MLKWLIERRLTAFEQSFDYDMGYARAILKADTGAFLAFSKLMGMSRYRRDVPVEVYFAVKLVGTLAEDCGPCTQLMIAMALREGAPPAVLKAVLAAKDSELPAEVRLGVEFARAVLARSGDAETLRERLLERYGERGMVSLAFALTAARLFPTVKYALGYGSACQRVQVEGSPVAVVRAA